MSIDIPTIKRPKFGFPGHKNPNGTRGNDSKKIILSKPLERRVNGCICQFPEAEIIPGKENTVKDSDYSFIYGRIRFFNSEEEMIYSEKIEIVIEDGKYIPREFHPRFKYGIYPKISRKPKLYRT